MSRFCDELEVTPLADGQSWRLNKTFGYLSTLLADYINVPAGFVTDFASVPKLIRGAVPVWNRYGPAAVLHDWLYWSQTTPREVADEVLLEAMRALGVDDLVAQAIHAAVRLAGQPAWDNNAELKASKYRRMAGLGSNPPYAAL